MKNSHHDCPKCGSTVTKRCRVLHEQSISEGSHHESQRAFGKRAEPPRITPKAIPVALMAVGAVLLLGGAFLWGLASSIAGAILYYQRAKFEPVYNESLELYERLWICMDCGEVFEPGAAGN
ncbi:hypothetical protein [Pseudomonas sp. LRF_L74]|uniref:hypothetical protein n=1 Tax=Pseudomonas sp. LRF_L74 TaxID=3369422 RepID=UPI003F5E2466